MLDLRELVAALDDEDRRLWTLHRTEMRRSYMTAHNSVLGIVSWTEYDDAFLDIIDIKLALLFDKSGRMAHRDMNKTLVSTEDAKTMEGDIEKELSSLKVKTNGNNDKQEPVVASEASKSLTQQPHDIPKTVALDSWGAK